MTDAERASPRVRLGFSGASHHTWWYGSFLGFLIDENVPLPQRE